MQRVGAGNRTSDLPINDPLNTSDGDPRVMEAGCLTV